MAHRVGAWLTVFAVVTAAAVWVEARSFRYYVVSDDLYDTIQQLELVVADLSGGDTGKGNNGHGNNDDGVDSSNPGQGQGGPNGQEDPSGGVDDESGGGNGNGKNKNK